MSMQHGFLSQIYMTFAIGALGIIALVVGKTILIPVTLALFLSLGLSPIVKRLMSWKIPKALAILMTFVIGFIFLGVVGYAIGFAVSDFTSQLPSYQSTFQSHVASTQNLLLQKLSWSSEELSNQISSYLSTLGLNVAGTLVTASAATLATFGLTLMLTSLMLIYRERIKKFFQLIANENQQQEIETIAHRSFKLLPQYILGLVQVIAIMVILCSLAFWIIGVPSPLFWGMIVAILNVIPYVGTVIGLGMVVIFSLAVTGPTVAILAFVMFLLMQVVDNNFLTPIIAGGRVDVNPLAAILSIIIWGMIWGVPGMILALPILGLTKIICESIPSLRPFAYLIGDAAE